MGAFALRGSVSVCFPSDASSIMVSMNRLSIEKRAQIIGCLVEGNSIRGTVRITGAAKNTITRLLVELGAECAAYQDRVLRDLPCKTLQVDEMWGFCYAKQKNVPTEHQGTFGYGDVWTWVAIDADTKLVPTWLVGERNLEDCWTFIEDLKRRMAGRIQLSSDAHATYRGVVGLVFNPGEVDWAQLVKHYQSTHRGEGRYSPPTCVGAERRPRLGNPDPAKISTSYVERQNLTMRMGMRRFTRLTNAFSKKVENLAAAVSLHYMHYNFARPHGSLANPYPRTPAMAAGVAEHVWTLEEIAGLLDPN
jgi:IS1 family transposase